MSGGAGRIVTLHGMRIDWLGEGTGHGREDSRKIGHEEKLDGVDRELHLVLHKGNVLRSV